MQDQDGIPVVVGVDHCSITIEADDLPVTFSGAQAEEFAQLFVSAVWQAGQQKARMDREASHG